MRKTKLQRSEELFHLQMECVKDHAFYMLDTKGKVLNWNAGAERLKGYSAEEIVGKQFSCFYPEEARNAGKPEDMLRKAAAEGRAEDEGWRVRKDGSRFWAHVIITAMREENGNLRGFSKVARDITERRKVQEALRLSEARYRALYHDNPTMIATLDGGLTMLSVNPIFSGLLGYTTDELEGRSVLEIFHEDDRPAVAEHLQKCLQNPGQVYHWQLRKVRRNGEPLWVEETAQAVYDLSGSLNILVVCQDVTERKRLEDKLKKASIQNELILASAGEGIVGLDLDGIQTFVNAAAAAMLGYEVNELVGKPSHAIRHSVRPDGSRYAAEKCPVYATYKDGAVYSGEEVLVRRDGTVFPVHFTSRPIYHEEKIVGAVLTFDDITERKQVEEALRQSEQRFASFMLHLPAAAWMKDRDGRYVYANAEAERIFSKPLSALLNMTDNEVFPPETARMFRENDEWVLANKDSLQTTEVLRQSNGIEHQSIVSKFPVLGPDGQAACVGGVALDITEYERLKVEIQRLASFPLMNPNPVLELDTDGRMTFCNPAAKRILEEAGCENGVNPFLPQDMPMILQDLRDKKAGHFVQELELNGRFFEEIIYIAPPFQSVRINTMNITKRKRAEEEIERLHFDLAARAADLGAANRELEAFNYTVAHDLRKPLTVINGYCQALQELCSDTLDEQCKGFIQEAYNGTWRMNRLIETLLDFSRLSHVEPNRETVDLTAMANKVAVELRLSEPGRRVTFKIADGISVYGDATLLRAVLDNLLGNAWKYSSTAAEGIIEFGTREVDGKPACFVRDNGAGFDMANAHILFAPFQRLPGAEKSLGFGIGLATVERIIHRHGGKVWAEGAPGQGATFNFTLGGDRIH